MLRVAAVAIGILSTCDAVAFEGKYTALFVRILSAIERSFV